jgi:hypothetical protein
MCLALQRRMMRKRLWIGLVVMIAGTLMEGGRAARAEAGAEASVGVQRGVVATVGVGLASARFRGRYIDDELYEPAASLHADVGFRVFPWLAAGAHLGITVGTAVESSGDPGGDLDIFYTPIEIGISAQLLLTRRLWIAPWAGLSTYTQTNNYYEEPDPGLAYGVAVGGDFYLHPDGHRVGVYARYHETAAEFPGFHGMRSVAAGVAYRFW